MPVLVAGWMFTSRPDYIAPLYTDLLGIGMLVSAVVMLGVGAFWISRIIKVEV